MKRHLSKIGLLLLFCAFNTVVLSQTTIENSDYNALIKSYLDTQRSTLGLKNSDYQSLIVNNETYSKNTDLSHVYLNQAYQGIPIYNAISSVAIKDDKIIYFANNFISNIDDKVTSITPAITPYQSIVKIADTLNLGPISQLNIIAESPNKYIFSNANIASRAIEVNKVLFLQNDVLKLVWDITLYSKDNKNWWRIKVDAQTNEIIQTNDYILSCNFDNNSNHINHNHDRYFSKNVVSKHLSNSILTPQDGSNYNVFAFPVESPNHGSRSTVTEPASNLASPFGWHDTDGIVGSEFTITRGNNVYAQEDRNGDNGIGFSPDGSSSLLFDYALDLNLPPSSYESASITNLFYANNMMHDIFYHHGFDELNGNFQETNYSGLGQANDFVFADAQDGSGLNNATFGTPPDGANPGMTMFLWSPPGPPTDILVLNNGSLAGGYNAVEANFGAEITQTPITADLVVADDQTGDIYDACESITNLSLLSGKIAIIRRGTCQFGFKVLQAEIAGALAVIIVNNVPGAPIPMGGGDNGASVTIPSVMVNQTDGEAMISALNNNETINATLVNNGPFEIDGSFDNVIIAHEYGHGISNRLTGGPMTADCLFNEEQMGEGWSDWFGLMVTMKATDTQDIARGIGTFAINQSTTGNGIRPARYSPNFSINPATYDLTNNPGLSVPHGVGFVWATMLWDLTWAYINKYGFDSDLYNGNGGNNKVIKLVVDGLKLQPCSPGFIDGRDALLAADMATTGGEDQCLIWEVFAARGLGFNASQGSSFSRSDQVEDFSLPPTNDPSLANCNSLTNNEFLVNTIKLYPNPTTDQLVLTSPHYFGKVSITLIDINGRVLYSKFHEFNSEVKLDISSFNQGVYILKVENNELNYSTKVIKN